MVPSEGPARNAVESDAVRLVQVVLKEAGFDPGGIDGFYGPATSRAVAEFQRARGLPGDGLVGAPTWRALALERGAGELKARTPSSVLKQGSFGSGDIRKAQAALRDAGYDPGTSDGVMGARTERAIRDFQRSRGIPADGVLGPQAWDELFHGREEAPTRSPVSRPGSSSPPLSRTMQRVSKELTDHGAEAEIHASEIARAIVGRHGEYAGGGFEHFTWSPDIGEGRPWPEWLSAVSELYDGAVLASTRHKGLDGRLFLVGLASLEPAFRDALTSGEVWVPLLLEIDEAAGPEGSALWSLLQEIQLGYGYRNDEASGADQLGIQGEVNALCAVITDRAVKPPLAVGLFGEWGTGKSFFMDRMREQVDALAGTSQTPAAEGDRPLNVVQIRFNAWHYSDSSLWASLAVEIFERIADPEPVGMDERAKWLRSRGDPRRSEREQLFEQLETFRGAKGALAAELGRLHAERTGVEARRDDAYSRRREVVESTRPWDIAGELAKDSGVREALDKISTELKVKPAVGELVGLATELRTMAGYIPAVWRLVRHKAWTVALGAIFVVLSLATAALVLRSGWDWVGSLATGAGSVAAAVIAATKLIRPAARQVNTALGLVESAIRAASAKEAELREKREREDRAVELELARVDEEIAQATQAIAALDVRIAETEASAEALSVGRQLYDFLADRATGYQKHQGVIGMLHRDFRLLDARLRAYRDAEEPVAGRPAVDRVILYIDDLDRCPPAKVLEVLEAVHLLLALEMFVVVVGVDPRWLQRSLRHQYRDLVTFGDPGDDPYLRLMPIEYLEKIFQIPLALPAMEPAGYARLIASLAQPAGTWAPPRLVDAAPASRPRESGHDAPGGERTPTRSVMAVEQGSAASGSVGRAIDLTQDEIEFAQRLGALVDSPRAAKRLMNTYRLIRATRHVGSRSRFLGHDGSPGEYRAVLTLLAVSAGYPTMADRLLVALEDDAVVAGIDRWPQFVAELDPAKADGEPGRLVPTDLRDDDPRGNADESMTWAAMHHALRSCIDDSVSADLEPYRRWGRTVARFSFTL